MAVTISIDHSDFDFNVVKNQYEARGSLTFDTSYPTGGEAVDFTSTTVMTGAGGAFTTVAGVCVTNNAALAADAGLLCTYDMTNKKFFLFESGTADAALDEVNDTQDRSGTVVYFVVYGV